MSATNTSVPTLSEQDLRWLVCPACRNTLHIDDAAILCSGCGRRYPILDGIPILLVDRAI